MAWTDLFTKPRVEPSKVTIDYVDSIYIRPEHPDCPEQFSVYDVTIVMVRTARQLPDQYYLTAVSYVQNTLASVKHYPPIYIRRNGVELAPVMVSADQLRQAAISTIAGA